MIRRAALAAVLAALAAGSAPAAHAGQRVGRPLTIAWGGDTTLGSSHGNPPAHGWSVLAGIAPFLRAADLTAVNSEGTFATGGTSKCGGPDTDTCFAFRAPPANAAALRRAGVDVANLANNHAFDFGPVGLAQTVGALHAQRIGVTGRPGEVLVRSVPGARIAFVGFAPYRWSAPLNDLLAERRLIARARRRANVVVVLFHGGGEGADRTHTPAGTEHYLGEDRGAVRRFAHAAVDAGADLVLGSGPHVLRGMERYRGRLIAYSLGNLAGWHNFGTGGTLSLSGVLRATVDADGTLLTGTFTSLVLDGRAVPQVDPARRSATLVSRLGRQDFGARGVRVRPDGRLVLPHRRGR
ncbi:MAG TPA: CapA family protein [Baekduia sp.]|nr:CapA family protein [Baekduia sp.]